jgi:hypothetical protein
MKTIISLVFCLLATFFSTNAQEMSILVQNKNSEKSIYLEQNKRIKVVTTDGRRYFGRFTVVDDKTISINNTLISLTSIEKIKRKSLVSTIATPIVCYVAVYLILGGTAVAAIGGRSFAPIGLGLISTGFALPPIALISNKHPKDQWRYTLVENPVK